LRYSGPKDVGRADSLYKSALTKPDPDYAAQLLFSALAANPEHQGAFDAIIGRIPAFAAKRRKMVVRTSDLVGTGPADEFIKSLAAFCAGPIADNGLACAAEAFKAGLVPYAISLGERLLRAIDANEWSPKAIAITRLIEVLEGSDALEAAASAARHAVRLYPDDQGFKEREKNLLARRYMQETDLASAPTFQKTMKSRAQQAALHRPTDHNSHLEGLENRYRQSHSLEDFRELVRALREAQPVRREAAITILQDGLGRFGDRDTRWFLREIELERKWAEVRLHQQMLSESPSSDKLLAEHQRLRTEVLNEHVEYLYEVVASLPPGTPDRHRRELELARKLLDAGRHEEAIKQAQAVKRRAEHRLEAWLIMAKSFVQLGWTAEAGECFEQILTELKTSTSDSLQKALEAKYSYAEFLIDQAIGKRDSTLAYQARKLCSDIMIEDIDFRDVRKLASRLERLMSELA